MEELLREVGCFCIVGERGKVFFVIFGDFVDKLCLFIWLKIFFLKLGFLSGVINEFNILFKILLKFFFSFVNDFRFVVLIFFRVFKYVVVFGSWIL